MKLEFSWQIFEKYWNIRFHENHFNGSRVVPCGRREGGTGMKKLIIAFRSFANEPKPEFLLENKCSASPLHKVMPYKESIFISSASCTKHIRALCDKTWNFWTSPQAVRGRCSERDTEDFGGCIHRRNLANNTGGQGWRRANSTMGFFWAQ